MSEFVSLAALVRAACDLPPMASAATPVASAVAAPVQVRCATPDFVFEEAPLPVQAFEHADFLAEVTLLRIAAIEAFERSVPRLLAELAHEVLGRELLLAAPDIDALVREALREFSEHEPVAITVAPCDVARVRVALPVRSDPHLQTGDLVVDVRDGAFESRRVLRLQHALERARVAG